MNRFSDCRIPLTKLFERNLMMTDKIKSSEKDSALFETPKGEDYRAVIDEKKCTADGECRKICETKAIYAGPKRIPSVS